MTASTGQWRPSSWCITTGKMAQGTQSARCLLQRATSGSMTLFLALSATLCTATSAVTASRSRSETAAFKRTAPCPATGERRGACPGYVIDHIEPLCAGGRDHPDNMQWQTVADAKAKDREEIRRCRSMKR